ncbi:MAG: hypothetical protein ACM3RP_00600, partial [Chitinophagales bacterium]
VLLSGLTGEGLPALFTRLQRELGQHWVRLTLDLPYAEGEMLGALQAEGAVQAVRYEAHTIVVEAVVSRRAAGRWRRYAREEKGDGFPKVTG